MAVGRERFRGDAAHVMGFLQQLQGGEMDPDDPTSSYMLQVGVTPRHWCCWFLVAVVARFT